MTAFTARALSHVPHVLRGITGNTLRPGGLALTERAADWCAFQPGARVLDIGCGLGATLMYLRDIRGCRACGLAISAQMLSECRGMPVLQAAGDILPFYDKCLDGIFCECVVSLLVEPPKAFREFCRVLRPAGWLVLTDVYLRNPQSGAGDLAASATCLSGASDNTELMKHLNDCGFDVILWEDHSRYLTELAARMVWTLGSRELLMQLLFPGGCSAENKQNMQGASPGYGLWIARLKGPKR